MSSSSQTTTAPAAGITGLGATDAQWNAVHLAAPGYPPKTAYDPNPDLPRVHGHTAAAYTRVRHRGGHVTGYDFHVTARPVAAAQALILRQELPADLQQRWFVRRRTCAQMRATSATLGQALGSTSIGDPSGTRHAHILPRR